MANRRGSLAEVWVADDEGNSLKLAFFNGWSVGRQLTQGARAIFHGKVGSYRDRPTLNNPDFTVLVDADPGTITDHVDPETDPLGAAELPRALNRGKTPVPLYPATAGISSFRILDCIEILLDLTDFGNWPEPLPESVRTAEKLPALGEAYRLIHRPETLEDPERGLRRMRYHEAFLLQGLLHLRRAEEQQRRAAPRPRQHADLLSRFDAGLEFTLTEGQVRCGDLIGAELESEQPMNRLLQGEVGSARRWSRCAPSCRCSLTGGRPR